MKRVLLVDNYDSFTYNLLHSLEKHAEVMVDVVRNDQLSMISITDYRHVVLSPGPGLPHEAGFLMPFIEAIYQQVSILGICLGHQALGQFFGAELLNLQKPLHGKQLETTILTKGGLFANIPEKILTGHYHSWVLQQHAFPSCLRITAYNHEGGVMAFEHRSYPIAGIQFHPESVYTPLGDAMIENWLNQD